ncbi:MAG: TolC family protein [Gammaproteobacteria bacterium]|nr:TolC family protein [Gammaproteobacteria bacterium]
MSRRFFLNSNMSRFSYFSGLFFIPLSLSMTIMAADSSVSEPIPEPLTLKYALSKASNTDSPEIMAYSAQYQMAQAEQDLAISEQGVFAEINGRLRYVDPSSIVPSSETNDSKLSLDIYKRLYDFGRTSANIEASKYHLASVETLYTDYLSKRKVSILQAYFNVLLADIIYDHANEAMAVDYVTLDKARSRFELKQLSEIDLLKIENHFRESRRERTQALSDQRLTRHRLAQLINPGHMSVKLDKPDLEQLHLLSASRELKDIEQLYEIAYEKNPRLIASNHELESVRLKISAFQAEKYPVISLNLQAADYARDLGSSDKYRAGIQVKIPLYQAGQENAKIKKVTGRLIQLEAEQLQIKRELEQQILELWLKISDLKQQYSDPDFNLEYRDLYLERSRALYELEVTSDLGDAMVELSQAQLFKAQTFFELAVAWAKLDSLTGSLMNYYE